MRKFLGIAAALLVAGMMPFWAISNKASRVSAQGVPSAASRSECHSGIVSKVAATPIPQTTASGQQPSSWLSDESRQTEVDSFWSSINSAGLDNIGAYIDDSAQQFVVVFDQGSSQVDAARAIATKTLQNLPWRVEVRCHVKADQEGLLHRLTPEFEKFSRTNSGLTASIRESDGAIVIHIAASHADELFAEIPQLKSIPVELVLDNDSPSFFIKGSDL